MIAEDQKAAESPAGASLARVTSVLSYVVLAAGIVTVLFTVFAAIRSYSPVWFADQWTVGEDLLASGHHLSFHQFWQQHNEHRIPIIRLVLLLDIYLFKGHNLFAYFVNWSTQLAMFGLSVTALRRLGRFSNWQQRTLIGLIAFCEFNPRQLENFTWAFQAVFFMTFLFALLAICCVALYAQEIDRQPERGHTRLLWFCVAAAFLAECSLASGLICWVVLPFCIGMLGLKRTLLRPFLVFGLVGIGIYLIGYQSPGGPLTEPSEALARPFQILGYIQTYFGASWDDLSRDWGMFVSPLAILFVALFWTRSLFDRQRHDRFFVVSISMAMFCLLAAVMTAMGRFKLGYNQASTSRYQTPAMLFWCFGAIAAVSMLTVSSRYKQFLAIQVACLGLFAAQANAYGRVLAQYNLARFTHDLSGLALESGIDLQKVLTIYPGLLPVQWYADMRSRQLIPPIFPEYSHVGTQLLSVYKMASANKCQGFLDQAAPVPGDPPGHVSARGWASLNSIFTERPVIILAANDGKIVGIGVTGSPRPDVVAAGLLPETELNSGWTGYAQISDSEKTLRAYKELPGGNEVCQLEGELTIARQ
jgi:hypothetical protein